MHEQKPQKGSEEWLNSMLEQFKTYKISEEDLAEFIHYGFEHPSDELNNKLREIVEAQKNEQLSSPSLSDNSASLEDPTPPTEE